MYSVAALINQMDLTCFRVTTSRNASAYDLHLYATIKRPVPTNT